ncbi:MAG: AEC family transporter [Desulfobacterales bacterium]|nr:AEC family transporter [Desulfobacterales bacterium]
MIFELFLTLLPLLILALGGYILSWLFSLSEETLVRVVTDFLMPALVFTSLYSSEINGADTLKMGGAVTFVLFILLIASIVYCRCFKLDARSFLPPIIFMNSGFLGIPLMELWGGALPMNLIVIYDQVQTFYIFTIGIIVVAGGFTASGLKEMIKTPLLWSIVLGFGFKYAAIHIPKSLLDALSYCGAGAPALATLALGCSLRKCGLKADPHILSGILLRFVVGFVAGVLATMIFDINGVARTVVIVASALPSAVFSYVLPLRYGANPEFAGGMVFITTLLSIFVTPAALYLCTIF